jgi:hypothetical protein
MLEFNVGLLEEENTITAPAEGDDSLIVSRTIIEESLMAELTALPPGVANALKGLHSGAYMMLKITGPIAVNWTEEGNTIRFTVEAVQ